MSRTARMWRVWITETARDTLIAAACREYPFETGGVLIGVFAWGRPWVTNAIEICATRSSTHYFELPSGARNRTVSRLRREDGRLGYLGDWHSHPMDVGPSGADRSTMARLALNGDCRHPLLFIVRRTREKYEIDPRQWTCASLRRLRIIEAGPLPASQASHDCDDSLSANSRYHQY